MTALIWCPFPDRGSATKVASALLDDRLIGCANILGPMQSLFEWDGERGESEEFGVLFKTDGTMLDDAVQRLEQLHPYDAPAVMGWRCDAAGAATADWLGGLAK